MTDHEPPADRPRPDRAALARSFGAVADAYDRGRPGYPRAAAAWLAGEQPCTVLEVGAGTGKLTDALLELGHDVHATDPDQAMLSRLALRRPDLRVSQAGAEELPVPDRSVDVVVGAQCFHWFDLDRALPEIARVLKPGGHVAMVWNERDERIPWVRRLGRILDSPGEETDWTERLTTSGHFGFVEQSSHSFWQVIDRDGLRDLVLSRSHVSLLPAEERERVLAEALDLYDGYGRGHDGMQMPYAARCWRSRVARRAEPAVSDHAEEADAAGAEPAVAADPRRVRSVLGDDTVDPPTDDDSGTLLIDFR